MKDIGIYIHIPFCERKCYYCDFLSFTNMDHMVGKYIDYLIKEMELYKQALKEKTIQTIFIGGGTPSAIDGREIYRLMAYLYKNFTIAKDLEATIEVNPASLTRVKGKIYRESGINRLSLGLQSLNDDLLQAIGRCHRVQDFYRSYRVLEELGFNNINLDMIFGLPDQTMDHVVSDLKAIRDLDIEHISYYSLIIEAGTPMAEWYRSGKLKLPNEDLERSMYYKIVDSLKDQGYRHYEISNFAKNGYECLHNKFYWKIMPYIGLGLNSHSNFKGKRYWNFSSFKDYFQALDKGKLPLEGTEIIDRSMEMAEYCIFGIRYIEGINKLKFRDRFELDIKDIYGVAISKHIRNGLLEEIDPYIRLTDRGMDLANQVEVDFLP